MKELTIDAAKETKTDSDREAIAKEIAQIQNKYKIWRMQKSETNMFSRVQIQLIHSTIQMELHRFMMQMVS